MLSLFVSAYNVLRFGEISMWVKRAQLWQTWVFTQKNEKQKKKTELYIWLCGWLPDSEMGLQVCGVYLYGYYITVTLNLRLGFVWNGVCLLIVFVIYVGLEVECSMSKKSSPGTKIENVSFHASCI